MEKSANFLGRLTRDPIQKRTRHCEEGEARRGNPVDFPETELVLPSIYGIATGLCPSQ
jgi:hypothetical protein